METQQSIKAKSLDSLKLDVEKLKNAFNSIVDFRQGLLEKLSPTEIGAMAREIGLELTDYEKQRYLNIERELIDFEPMMGHFREQGLQFGLAGCDIGTLQTQIRHLGYSDEKKALFIWLLLTRPDGYIYPGNDYYPYDANVVQAFGPGLVEIQGSTPLLVPDKVLRSIEHHSRLLLGANRAAGYFAD